MSDAELFLSRTVQELRLTQTVLSESNLARRAAAVAGMHAKVNITFTIPPRHTTWHSTQHLLILLAVLLIEDH